MPLTICPHCGSNNIQKLIGDDEPTIHHGRIFCGNCESWLGWIPNPEKIKFFNERNLYIDGLLSYTGINSWERTFLRNIKGRLWLSPKQTIKFDQICERLTGRRYENTPNRGSGRGERAIVDSC
ncbi:MAG: hypothetical protein AAFS12_00220 [Cyanobacteria bacterium J06632_19]